MPRLFATRDAIMPLLDDGWVFVRDPERAKHWVMTKDGKYCPVRKCTITHLVARGELVRVKGHSIVKVGTVYSCGEGI